MRDVASLILIILGQAFWTWDLKISDAVIGQFMGF